MLNNNFRPTIRDFIDWHRECMLVLFWFSLSELINYLESTISSWQDVLSTLSHNWPIIMTYIVLFCGCTEPHVWCRLCTSRRHFRTSYWPRCWSVVWLWTEPLKDSYTTSNLTSAGLLTLRYYYYYYYYYYYCTSRFIEYNTNLSVRDGDAVWHLNLTAWRTIRPRFGLKQTFGSRWSDIIRSYLRM